MALDLPPTPNCPQEIDTQVVSPLFQQMYSKAKTRRGFIMNIFRLLTSPLFLVSHIIFCFALSYVAMIWPVFSYFGLVILLLLIVLSLPAVIIGIVICVLIPFSFCVCPALVLYL